MAFLRGAWLPSVASLAGSNLNHLGAGSQKVVMADDTSLKVAVGGNEDMMMCLFYSHSGRPISVGMWGAGNEAPKQYVSSFATTQFTVQVGGGSNYDGAPTGTYGTDAHISLWNAYPQGSWIINRWGGTVYHSILSIQGAGS